MLAVDLLRKIGICENGIVKEMDKFVGMAFVRQFEDSLSTRRQVAFSLNTGSIVRPFHSSRNEMFKCYSNRPSRVRNLYSSV